MGFWILGGSPTRPKRPDRRAKPDVAGPLAARYQLIKQRAQAKSRTGEACRLGGASAAASWTSPSMQRHRINGGVVSSPGARHRTVPPAPGLRETVDHRGWRGHHDIAGVHLIVCVDTAGKVEDARAMPATRGRERYASYVRAVEAATSQWRFQPFEVHGKPVPVCIRRVRVSGGSQARPGAGQHH